MDINKLSPGDIGLVKGNGFVSKRIQDFMKIYKRKLGLPNNDKLYNHAFMVIDLWGQTYVAEALETGINIRPISEAYPDKKWSNIKVMTPKKAYTKEEQDQVSKVALAYVMTPTRYGFSDLLFHMMAILSSEGYDRWKGKVGLDAEKRMHCTEAVATWANKVRPDTFERPWSTNPVDIEYNKYYKVKEL